MPFARFYRVLFVSGLQLLLLMISWLGPWLTGKCSAWQGQGGFTGVLLTVILQGFALALMWHIRNF